MLRNCATQRTSIFVRYASQGGYKRWMQTVPSSVKRSPVANFGSLNYQLNQEMAPVQQQQSPRGSRWSKHSLTFPSSEPQEQKSQQPREQHETITIASPPQPVARKSRTSRFRNVAKSNKEVKEASAKHEEITNKEVKETPATKNETSAHTVTPATEEKPSVASAPLPKVNTEKQASEASAKPKKARRQLRPRKALITLSPGAIKHLRALIDQPEPRLVRIGVRNRGCSGLTYHLEYVTEPGKFDELVEQDGVKVLIDSKALFSIVGSEMDWIDDKLSSRFIFKNPNSKGTCGCGESFMV
ncbi:iron-sulfur assembly protein 1 [Candidozyma haemuli]|uniref:Iron-sulfur assembly protein 1 n=1 Tax=Candidozyma haemuli TaxID=45357 RepID=A0A2V1ARI7_9ASCO|nr:iron-sulfur assembly protein 1 [[Candida] haemuloni]PVH19873.1 iron-sulfur assembly protein 1 [[Candida] haemuloni]